MEWLFGRRKTLPEYGREWKLSIDKQKREIDRDIAGMRRAEERTQREIRAKARLGETATARTMARELVRSRKTRARLEGAKAQMNAAQNKLSESIAMANLSGAIKKSADLMQMMKRLVNLPQLQTSMMTMSKEMQAMDLISEAIDEAMEEMDEEDVEEDINEAIDQVMDEIALGMSEDLPGSNALLGFSSPPPNNRVRVDQIMGNTSDE